MHTKRKIPATMVTQHPDHANAPYWHDKPFISTQEEPYECYLAFSELGATEYKWDWEGKLVDEAVVERIMSQYYDYFKQNPIGVEKFITFRLPNPKVETEFRLGRAFMGILAASGLASKLEMGKHPLFEVILPMTETAEEMIGIQEAFREVAEIKHPLLKRGDGDIEHIELIPLFEDIHTIANSKEILEKYWHMHEAKFGTTPEYMRPYVARSDPALNAGIVPTVLAIKLALSGYRRFSEEKGIELYPIIGAAALPFRGGISPRTIDQFINEYKGVRTTTIQSAFRYDFPKEEAVRAIGRLESELVKHEASIISAEEEKGIRHIMAVFEGFYKPTIEKIAPIINTIAASIPKRRERVQHVGLFGYSRGVGSVKLPRAISFTGALYSLGIPPELIGTGRGLKAIKEQGNIELLEKHYINIRANLMSSYSFLNKAVLDELAKKMPGFSEIKEDVKYIEEYLGPEALSTISIQKEHQEVSQMLFGALEQEKQIQEFIVQSAHLRHSIG